MATAISFDSQQSSTVSILNIVADFDKTKCPLGLETVNYILKTRENEKQELKELNNLLEEFIGKVGRINAENRNFEHLKAEWERELEKLKLSLQNELTATEQSLEQSINYKTTLEAKRIQFEFDLEELRKRLNLYQPIGTDAEDLEQKLRDTEKRLHDVQEHAKILEAKLQSLQRENTQLNAELKRVKQEWYQECLTTLRDENVFDTLRKKNTFLPQEYSQDVPRAQISTGRQSVRAGLVDCHQIATSIREIRSEFDDWATQNRNDVEELRRAKAQRIPGQKIIFVEELNRLQREIERYRAKLMESESENSRLQRELSTLLARIDEERRQHEKTLNELKEKIQLLFNENLTLQKSLKVLLQSNQTLRAELAIYRKMVGGRTIVPRPSQQPIVIPPPPLVEDFHMRRDLLIVRTPTERTYRFNVQFGEVAVDGSYIVLENVNVNAETMDGWKLKRAIDGVEQPSFIFPQRFSLQGRQSVKIWHRGHGTSNQHIFDGNLWDERSLVICRLLNEAGVEQATFTKEPARTEIKRETEQR